MKIQSHSAILIALCATLSQASAQLTWDANGTGAGQTNGGAAWLGTNLWYNGATNQDWVSGSNAVFGGPSTAGGAVTLASPTTVGSITFNTFTGTYTLGTPGNTLTMNGGITMNSSAGAVTISSPVTLGAAQTWTNNSAVALTTGNGTNLINNGGFQLTVDGTGVANFGVINNAAAALTGSGGLVKNGSGRLNIGGVNSGLSGTVTINGGVMQVFNDNNPMGNGNLTLNGGVISWYWGTTYTRSLGTGNGMVQILGGESGFAGAGTTGPTINLGTTVVWGASGEGSATGYFNPGKFVVGDAGTTNAAVTTFSSGIDLNAATRAISVPYGFSAGGNSSTMSGVISNTTGTAGLTKEGGGKLTVTGANTFNGPVTVSQGILSINSINTVANANPLGQSPAAAANLVLANGTTLQYTGGAASCDRSFTINGTAAGHSVTLDASGSGALNLTGTATPAYGTVDQTRTLVLTGSNTGSNILAASIANNGAGAVSVTKTGAGTWQLSGTSTYTGPNTLSGGLLGMTTAGNLGDSSSTIIFNGGGLQILGTGLTTLSGLGHSVSVNAGSSVWLDINNAGNTFTVDQAIPGATFIKSGAGTLIFNQANTYSGSTTISGGSLQFNDSGVMSSAPLLDNGVFTVNRSGTTTMGTEIPSIIGGTGSLVNAGSGTLVLNAPTYFTGTTKATAGKIKLSNNLALQYSAIDTTSVAGSFTLNTGITSLTIGGLSGASGNLASVFDSTYANVTALTLNPQSGSVTYGGVIANGASGMTLTMSGAGTQALQGANTYSGATYLNAGTLELSGAGSILNTAITFGGGGLKLTNTAAETGSGRVSDSAAITSNGGTLTYSNTSGANVYAETLGAVALTSGQLNIVEAVNQAGAGSQTLTLGGLTQSGTSAVTFSAASGLNTTRNMIVVTGASATTAGQIIAPWATTGTAANAQTNYAIYNASAQVVPAAIAASAESTWTTAANAYTANAGLGGLTLTGTRNIAALRSVSATNTGSATSGNANITLTSHTFAVGDAVVMASAAPTGFTAGNVYYVIATATNTFQLSATPGGAAITPTSNTAPTLVAAALLSTGNNLGTTGILNGVATTMTIAATGTGAVTLPTTTSDNLYVTPGSGAVTINAPITNNGAGVLTLVKAGSGNLTLNGTNTYSGGTVINSGSVTVFSAANLGGTGANLTFNGTGSYSQGYGSVISLASLAVNGAGTTATLNGGSGSTNSLTFTGPVTGNGTLVVTSAGGGYSTYFYLTSTSNSFTGPIVIGSAKDTFMTVNSLADSLGAGSIRLGATTIPGSFSYDTTGTATTAPLTLNNRQIVLTGTTGGGTLQNNSTSQAITVNTDLGVSGTGAKALTLGAVAGPTNSWAGKIIDGPGSSISVTKSGTGTWALSGANTYTGTTTISAGTLLINGNQSAATGAVAVNGTSTLGGNGTLGGTVTVAAGANLAPGADLAPGTSAGTLSISGGLNISAPANGGAGKLKFDLGPTAASDKIAVGGTLTIGNGQLGFSDFNFSYLTGGPQAGTYVLITSGGINPGDSLKGTDLSGPIGLGGTGTLAISGNNIVMTVTGIEDTDGDGIPDTWTNQYFGHPTGSESDLSRAGDDADGDGLTNLQEYQRVTLPKNPDTDADGLLDGVETNTGIWVSLTNTGTSPILLDTDGDTIRDGYEKNTGTFNSATDTGTNPNKADTDADSLADNLETGTGVFISKTNTGTNPNVSDTDNDGAGDWYEVTASFTSPFLAGEKPNVPYPLPDPDASTGNPSKKVKVYIMSGQSNMVGAGAVSGTGDGTLETMTLRQNKFPNLVTQSGAWTAREDVYYRGVISATADKKLGPGCGANSDQIGPELGFGHVMGWFHDEGVLLLKSSIGNRALGWDILPAGSARYEFGGFTYCGSGDAAERWAVGSPAPTWTTGNWYAGYEWDRFFRDESEWIHPHAAEVNVVDILDNWSTQYYGKSGQHFAGRDFEIAGFVWWQGERDTGDAGHSSRYEQNLVHLINSLRSYYSNRYEGKVVANAPFVMATLGETSDTAGASNSKTVFDAMMTVGSGNYPNLPRVKTVYSYPLSEGGSGNGHYNNRAGTYMLVGDAMGRAMIDLQAATGGNTYASWIAGFPSVPSNLAGFGQDADGDGIDNGAENFFGTNPGIGSSGMVAGASSGNTFTFTHPQNATPATGVTATYRWSKDLTTFLTHGQTDGDNTTVSFSPPVTSAGITTVTATVTGTPTAKLFVDVRVNQN